MRFIYRIEPPRREQGEYLLRMYVVYEDEPEKEHVLGLALLRKWEWEALRDALAGRVSVEEVQ